jgi:hypothetical protein
MPSLSWAAEIEFEQFAVDRRERSADNDPFIQKLWRHAVSSADHRTRRGFVRRQRQKERTVLERARSHQLPVLGDANDTRSVAPTSK